MSTVGLIAESLKRPLSGLHLGALSRFVPAGDGEILEVVWICSGHRHQSDEQALACATDELASQRRYEREAAREREAAGWHEESDDPDSLFYRG